MTGLTGLADKWREDDPDFTTDFEQGYQKGFAHAADQLEAALPKPTIITEDAPTRPPAVYVLCRHPILDEWSELKIMHGLSLRVGCVWWPISEGLFEVVVETHLGNLFDVPEDMK